MLPLQNEETGKGTPEEDHPLHHVAEDHQDRIPEEEQTLTLGSVERLSHLTQATVDVVHLLV